jgi:RNA polymerase sigma factor (TIGR02999 family)
MPDVTQILSRIEAGDPSATDELFPLVYEELRRLAAHRLAREKPGQTLQATALVHEAYLRLVDVEKSHPWNSRGHFLAAAAEAMRRILIEHARAKYALKRGGHHHRVELDEDFSSIAAPCDNLDDLLALDEALSRLAKLDAGKAELVKLLYFAGLNLEEAAAALGISRTTAYRHWIFSRAWLADVMTGNVEPS